MDGSSSALPNDSVSDEKESWSDDDVSRSVGKPYSAAVKRLLEQLLNKEPSGVAESETTLGYVRNSSELVFVSLSELEDQS